MHEASRIFGKAKCSCDGIKRKRKKLLGGFVAAFTKTDRMHEQILKFATFSLASKIPCVFLKKRCNFLYSRRNS
jgi:hypothetical protein